MADKPTAPDPYPTCGQCRKLRTLEAMGQQGSDAYARLKGHTCPPLRVATGVARH